MQIPTDTQSLLRLEVGRLRFRESRRRFDTMVYVGVLGGDRTSFVARAQDLPALDAALMTDVVDRLLEDTPGSWCTAWLTRAGVPEPADVDLAWLAAARSAFGRHGRTLGGFYAVTRTGWLDVPDGGHRTWKRLRLDRGD